MDIHEFEQWVAYFCPTARETPQDWKAKLISHTINVGGKVLKAPTY